MAIAALLGTACSPHGSQNSIPQIPALSNPAALRQLAVPAATLPQFSVAIGDVSLNGFVYEICDKNVWYAMPSTNPCSGTYAPPVGQKSISRSATLSQTPCVSGEGNCSLSTAMKASMGVFTESASTTVAPSSAEDALDTVEGQQSQSVWNDVMTVNSTTLPPGTSVTISEREAVSGTFDLPCDLGYEDLAIVTTGGYAGTSVSGSCNNGVFQWTNGANTNSMSQTKRFNVAVGQSYVLSAELNVTLQATDCTTYCQPGGFSTQTASVSNLVARTTYKPITSGVTLSFASGAAY
jgi:hypothetical protein